MTTAQDTAPPSYQDVDPPHLRELVGIVGAARYEAWDLSTLRQALAIFASTYAERPATLTPATSHVDDVLADLQARIDHFRETGKPRMGWLTGLPTLDDHLGGLQAGRLSILIAQPGQGKTTLASQIAYGAAVQGAPVLYLSFENTAQSLIMRTIARIANHSVRHVERGECSLETLAPAVAEFQRDGRSLYFIDGGRSSTIEVLEGYAAQLVERHPGAGAPLIVTDYLQRLAATDVTEKDARIRVERTSQRMSELAKTIGAHVLSISSTNRQAYNTKESRPTLASARESGAIEFDADHVISLAKPQNEVFGASSGKEPLTMEVAKNRHGSMGEINLYRDWYTLAITEPKLAESGSGASWAAGRNGRAAR